jgi:RNA polymerase sigma-70 factor (ECF subfamily)
MSAMAASASASVADIQVTPSRMESRPPAAAGDDAAWIVALRRRDGAAILRLHELLVRAARFEVSRRRASLSFVRGEELDDLAMQAADDALVAVLAKLDDFREASRFTTWVYKFALLEAGVRVRRRAWQNREVVLDAEAWKGFAEAADGPDVAAERRELLSAIGECIGGELTPHQRQVLVALAIDGVPIDVLAERLATTRGALYKTLHDARRRLRRRLVERGLGSEIS